MIESGLTLLLIEHEDIATLLMNLSVYQNNAGAIRIEWRAPLCCHLVRLRLVFAGGELYSQWGFENIDKETDDGVNMDG